MGAFLVYSLMGGLLMLAMYPAYRLLLARENQPGFNRGVLLAIYFVSFVAVPLIFFAVRSHSFTGSQVDIDIQSGAGDVDMVTEGISKPLWGTVLIWIYMAGMILVAVRTAITWIRLNKVVGSGERIGCDGYTLVVTDDESLAPFSWMRYIVVSRKAYEAGCPLIITHELTHIASGHRIDLIIARAVCIINWFNPVAWLMRDDLMLVHEYQADMAVIAAGHDAQEYQMLLIENAVGSRFPSLANSLNHSKLKKRITMMYKERSGAGRKMKALALVPMLALALGMTTVPAVRAAVSVIGSSEVSAGKDSKKVTEEKMSTARFKVTNINRDGNETTVLIKGDGLGSWLTVSGGTFTNNGTTYEANSMKCYMTDGVASITVTFPFSNEFKDSWMTLMVNGEEVSFALDDFFSTGQSDVQRSDDIISAYTLSAILVNSKSPSQLRGMRVYVDGGNVSENELKELSSDRIASMSVDRQTGEIRIITVGKK